MWAVAMVQGPNVTYFDGNSSKRENMNEFANAVNFLLKNGWEPFSAGDNNLVVLWFRKKVS